ncbi:sulfotransferase [Candidatus Parabeggiatoa sp. HSG14]|uniref:sulfotransferase family protein n=1 Tax=Candidatus Parabeggiatoa sp. HSG14 TaxID=3055593 RepID=UPI0025A8052E|nr:sulfotransferase [Thiotrichales bacterium HSG14]
MSRRWIFVIGCYNSGTTLLENILHQHPAIAGLPGEGQFLTDALITPKDAGVPRLWVEKENLFRFLPGEKSLEAAKVQQDWIGLLDNPKAPFAIEKSPTNAARTLWLQQYFDKSYFIHIVRNGYAVAMGIHDKVLAVYGDRTHLLEKAAHQWGRSLEIVLEDTPNLTHFLEIRYEAFTANPINVMAQICHFLGIPPLPQTIFEQEYAIHELQSKITNKNSVRLSKMTVKQKEIIYAQAGKLLDKYGYSANN